MKKEKSKEVVGTLLTIGDELLLGDIINGNARHIAYQLRCRGFRLDRMLTVGDGEDEIIRMLAECLDRCDFLIVTGGLGPTDDDRTCPAVAKAFGRPLVSNPGYLDWLKRHLEEYGITWTREAARMAQLPEGARKLGLEMAGFSLEHGKTPCYFLPGVPHEMRQLLDLTVLPDLEEHFPERVFYLKHILRVQGLYESELNKRLRDLPCEEHGVQIGYLPQLTEIWITLFVGAASEDEARLLIGGAETMVIDRIGAEHISGHNDESLEVVVGRYLRERGWNLSAAESCTGGMLSSRITSVPGASEYFDRAFITYSNKAKTDLLCVPPEMIRVYGAVSEPVARSMAEGARTAAGTHVAVAVTGIAGPSGGTDEKPVGTVFLAVASPEGTRVEEHHFGGSREQVQESSTQAALVLLWRSLSDGKNIHSD